MDENDDVTTAKKGEGILQPVTTHDFEDRKDYVTVGGFKHAPNIDSIRLLKYEIWPRIRKQLPTSRLHIYGAYPTHEILAMHDERTGFIVHGAVDDLDAVLRKGRVLLALLRFGAGIKGKIVDAWRCGCPVVTSPVGAEGMTNNESNASSNIDGEQFTNEIDGSWGGMIASDTNNFVDAAVKVYTHKDHWRSCQDKENGLLKLLFDGRTNLPLVEDSICNGIMDLSRRRRLDVVGAILWRGAQRSTEYFSRWIELKESLAAKDESR